MSTTRRTPGRPAEFDRSEALDALVGLFWLRGYDGATQEAMRASTGLSSSSLFRTFGTKAQTFDAVLRRYLELSDGMLAPLEDGTQGAADLHALLDRISARVGGSDGGPDGTAGCMIVAMVQDPVNKDPAVAALTARHLARMRSAIGAAVGRAHAAGDPLPAPPEEFTHVLYAAMLGMLVSARTGDVATTRSMINGVRALLPPER
ncbi:MAG TPA: helix-turn-helix domain-containing protein [Pseudonocardia sp.]|jgi:AcrR family transcriptional regulator|nr:helix-turn-helix domain-containing protein [Pseudonocardia sp.]